MTIEKMLERAKACRECAELATLDGCFEAAEGYFEAAEEFEAEALEAECAYWERRCNR